MTQLTQSALIFIEHASLHLIALLTRKSCNPNRIRNVNNAVTPRNFSKPSVHLKLHLMTIKVSTNAVNFLSIFNVCKHDWCNRIETKRFVSLLFTKFLNLNSKAQNVSRLDLKLPRRLEADLAWTSLKAKCEAQWLVYLFFNQTILFRWVVMQLSMKIAI